MNALYKNTRIIHRYPTLLSVNIPITSVFKGYGVEVPVINAIT